MSEDIPFYAGFLIFFTGLLLLIGKGLLWMYHNHQIIGLSVALIFLGIVIMLMVADSPPPPQYEAYE